MKFIKIPKKNGTFRTVISPSRSQKRELRSILYSSLNKKQLELCDKEIVHGFMPNKNIVTNAVRHIGYNFTFSIDIADFFDSITVDQVKEYLDEKEISLCFINGRAYQGLPTSPCLGNISTIKIVKEIKEFLTTINDKIVFGLYADDYCFSFNEYSTYNLLKTHIPIIIEKYGFKVNPKKYRLQSAKFGRRSITGIYVDDKQIYTSRKFRRRLRVAKHKNSLSLSGLEEFNSLKFPNPHTPEKQLNNLVKTAIVVNNKAMFKNVNNPEIQSVIKPTVERLQNIKFDPTRRNKYTIKNIIKDELAKGIIDKELLKKVSKLNKE